MLTADNYFDVMSNLSSEEISSLKDLCQESRQAYCRYVKENQWSLDKDIVFVTNKYFYEELPLTKYHIYLLNEALNNQDQITVHDSGILYEITHILTKEFNNVSAIQLSVECGLLTHFNEYYLELLKHPVSLHVHSNQLEKEVIMKNKDNFLIAMRTGKGETHTDKQNIFIPPTLLKNIIGSPISASVHKDFSFDGLCYAEIISTKYEIDLNLVRRISGRYLPIKRTRRMYTRVMEMTRTDLPPNNKEFSIIIDPLAKLGDTPKIAYYN